MADARAYDKDLPKESFVNQEDFDYLNDFEPNIAKRFGNYWPVVCSGGIGFGAFILYKSRVDKLARLSKSLMWQYQICGVSLIALNAKSLWDWVKK